METDYENKINFAGLLCGLKTYIDESVEKVEEPLKAMAIYKEKFNKFKEKFGEEYKHENSIWERNKNNEKGKFYYNDTGF